ncbi:MAG TPA: FG-GAP-like repeat-containing protein [Candidatus Acidoferrum sp.]|nr:FG-GAP-like repeat-containing protein [Candidatus Acidoferrum sp.]
MKKVTGLAVMIVVCLAHAGTVSAQCQLIDFSPLSGAGISLSQGMYDLLTSPDPNINPGLINAVVGAHNAWDDSNAKGWLGNYTGVHDGAECPANQTPFQLGAFDFTNTQLNMNCATTQKYQQAGLLDPMSSVAFVDYFSNNFFLTRYGFVCLQCGTKSITFNLHFTFSLNPAPGQWDVGAVLAHEFGHMLGFAHMTPGRTCQDERVPAPHCSQNASRNTMGNPVFDGETCERDISDSDRLNANLLYPHPLLQADIVVYRPNAGAWLVRRAFDGALTQVNWGCGTCLDKPVAADYDGDGFSDVAVYRNGEWLIQRSSDGGTIDVWWGCVSCGDIPVPADYDGDGRADIAVYRPTTGQWFILRSSDGGLTQVNWGCGSCGDIPVPANYDGDGKADIAVYRQSTGQWFILRSSDGGVTQPYWGCVSCGDIPVPADFDGDHRADIAVYRPSTGDWFILRSSDGGLTQTNFGCPGCGDVPVPADYDGDGRIDIAVYRPGTAEWFILQTSAGYRSLVWNTSGHADQPVKFLKR